MRKFVFKLAALLLGVAVCLLLLPTAPAQAVGVSVGGGGTCNLGDTVSVRVSFSGTNILGAQATFSYDRSVLSFAGGSNASDGNIVLYGSATGLSSLSTTLSFTAVGYGSTSVSVNCTAAYDADENSLGGGSGSVSFTVAAPVVQTRDPNATPAPTPVPVSAKEIPVIIGEETLYLWHTTPEDVIPEGFSPEALTYHGESVTAGHHTGGDIWLTYLTDGAGNNGRCYIYDPDNDSFSLYLSVSSTIVEVVLLPFPEDVQRPVGFEIVQLQLSDTLIADAWNCTDASYGLDGLYVLYGCSLTTGQKGLYMYDSSDGSLQHFTFRILTVETTASPAPATTEETPSPAPEAQPTPGSIAEGTSASGIQKASLMSPILWIAAGLIVLLLIVIIILVCSMETQKRNRRRRR